MSKILKALFIVSFLFGIQNGFSQNDESLEIIIKKKITKGKESNSNVTNELTSILVKKEVKKLTTKITALEKQLENGEITPDQFKEKKSALAQESAERISTMVTSMTDKSSNKNIYVKKIISNDSINKPENKSKDIMTMTLGAGWNNWTNSDKKMYDNKGSELDFGNSMYFKIAMIGSHYFGKKKRASFDFGLEYYTKNYRLKDETRRFVNTDNGVSTKTIELEPKSVVKSRFNQSTLEVPLSLSHEFGKDKFVSLGFYGGVTLRSKQVVKYSGEQTGSKKTKWKGDFDTNPFVYGALFRIGKRSTNFQVKVQLNEVFNKHVGLEAYPFMFGINIGGL